MEVRMTRQRQLILDIINSSYAHLTAEGVYTEARQKMPKISLGTVYRNLGLLAQNGEIRRIVLENQPDRYDRRFPGHDHFVCPDCGAVRDIPAEMSMEKTIERKLKMKPDSYELTVKIVCDECKDKK